MTENTVRGLTVAIKAPGVGEPDVTLWQHTEKKEFACKNAEMLAASIVRAAGERGSNCLSHCRRHSKLLSAAVQDFVPLSCQ
jgi:hypothetical protein